MSDEDSSPGWEAIDAALEPLYGQQKPRHWAAVPHRALGGRNPLDGVSAYEASGPRHWHFVSYGMSDLYQKETDDPEVSGWGFELTLRLKPYDEAEPPVWALNFLNNLGRYVFQSGNPFDVGHHMDLNGPIALGSETAIRAITFARDVQLGSIQTPHGRVTFLQAVGLTLDEYDAVQTWDAEKFLGTMAKRDPMLLTDLRRESWLHDASFACEVDEGRRRDGSSQHVAFVGKAEWQAAADSARVVLGAKAVQALLRVLPWRLPFGRSLAVAGRSQTIRFDAGESTAWRAEPDVLVVTLTPDSWQRFCEGLVARRGSYRWEDLRRFELEVVPSEIKDPEGMVIQVVG
jgi:suppressor of fused-like protein